MKPYLAYKDSGIEWIGKIPEHWDIKKLKYLVSSVPNSFVDGPFGSNLKNEEYQDSGIPLIQLNNIGIGKHLIQNLKFVSKEKSEELFKHKAYPNDIVIAKMAEPVARAAKVKSDFDEYVIVADCMKLSPNDALVNTDYLIYSMNTDYVRAQAEMLSSGTTRIRIGLTDSKKIRILLPPLYEQQSVNNFLNHKTSQIDTLIEKKQKQIELLKEERTAIINQAVTKGLNPDVPMKDSGIEWLGEMPEHWEVVGLTKYLESIVDYRGKTPPKTDKGIFLVTARNIKGGVVDYTLSQEYVNTVDYQKIMSRGYPEIGDVLFTTEAPLGEVANVDNENIALAQRIIKFRGHKNYLDNYFLKYWLLSYSFQSDLQRYATGSTALGIKASKLNKLKLVLPPVVEQKLIVSFLGSSHSYIEALNSKIQNQIILLQEYRTALISNAVTGKIDVRDTPTDILE